mmetsp:Transcript_64107/g.126144  ORF Transcript_64107/g.126144 Transcript_64107/m.126144 type:complete len:216 (+) Transcript_64107:389-1036(+)
MELFHVVIELGRVAKLDVDRFAIALGVQDERLHERLEVEELDKLRALECHLGELAGELMLDHLLHPAEADPIRVVRQHPEEHHAQVIHVPDLLAVSLIPVSAGGRRRRAEHGLDGLEHLAVVHDELPVLQGQLDHVADLAEGERLEERQLPLSELARHAITPPRERVVPVEEFGELLPDRLIVGVIGGVDVDPALEPSGLFLFDEEDRRLIGLRS